MPNPCVLTASQVATFHRDGFVAVPAFVRGSTLQELIAWTDDLQARPEAPGRQMKYFEDSLLEPGRRVLSRLENFCPFHPGMNGLAQGRLAQAVDELMGETSILFKDKINFKMPGSDGFKPHQDAQAGWDGYAPFFVTALVAIDAATLENGCLEMAAGHHKRGLFGQMWKPLGDDELAGIEFKPFPAEPGDAMFFDCFAPHRSAPNLTGAARRVLYITYNRAAEGDHRARYYADKRKSFPPDVEREPGRTYTFRV